MKLSTALRLETRIVHSLPSPSKGACRRLRARASRRKEVVIEGFTRVLAAAAVALAPQVAQGQSLIRDTETEAILRQMGAPLARAAGLGASEMRIYLIDDDRMNAFVTPGGNIFIHTAMIDRMDRADMVQSVIAHEIGHIVSDHVTTRIINARAAQSQGAAGIALGVLAGIVAGPEAGLAIAAGSQGAAERSFLSF
ncbi:MAG: M48 family metallopeptidase, partial [Rubricella sp.]